MFDIEKMVVISTGHLTQKTRDAIENDSFIQAFWISEYGFITYVSRSDLDNFSKDLIDCFVWAQDNGFDWIRWDVDGNKIDLLPYYEYYED